VASIIKRKSRRDAQIERSRINQAVAMKYLLAGLDTPLTFNKK
jgi:hypothetical protein